VPALLESISPVQNLHPNLTTTEACVVRTRNDAGALLQQEMTKAKTLSHRQRK
jgi:hypothetical protein